MRIKEINELEKIIRVEIPLTSHSGKIRVKQRKSYIDFGIPVATRKIALNQNMYIEWQISYDIEINSESINFSYFYRENTVSYLKFRAYNNKLKTLYELSEYIFYFYKLGVITKEEINSLVSYVSGLKVFIEDTFSITKSYPRRETFHGLEFLSSEIRYPHLIYDFGNGFLIVAEITIREKQKAVGVQPMLYICFPITCLVDKDGNQVIGRIANQKEIAFLDIKPQHKEILIHTLKVFSVLSKSHRHDILEILKLILMS